MEEGEDAHPLDHALSLSLAGYGASIEGPLEFLQRCFSFGAVKKPVPKLVFLNTMLSVNFL